MPKSLGQLHTVNYYLEDVATGDIGLLDLPGELSSQLQHQVRAMSSFKVAGIDISISPTSQDIMISGTLGYYAPTQGRVEALKMAWKAVRELMQLKGINFDTNLNYDFRPPMFNPGLALLTGAEGSDFGNQASIETVGGVAGPLCLADGPAGYNNIFEMYNSNISPGIPGAPSFSDGFIDLSGTTDDLVLNEKAYLVARVPTARTEMEYLSFQISSDASNDIASPSWMWRPDPALYLSVLTGQFQFACTDSSQSGADLKVAIHVAGWKGILGARKKRRRSKKGGKKGHGRKRRTSKR